MEEEGRTRRGRIRVEVDEAGRREKRVRKGLQKEE